MHKLPVGVLGASGYAGRELCSLIVGHPRLELAFATANERSGEQIRLNGQSITLIPSDSADLGSARLVFSALPHGHSAEWSKKARAAGAKVVDLSSDLRPGHGDEGIPYGLTETARDQVRGADLVANPGCYPTAILLALLPLLKSGKLMNEGTISVSAASGTTGAGSSARTVFSFPRSRKISGPMVSGIIIVTCRRCATSCSGAGQMWISSFTPHLLPVARGILATITVPLKEKLSDPLALWRERYDGEPFVEITEALPTLRDVAHRNVVRITALPAQSLRQPTLIVLAAIDNLVKGAAGQALQNANLMLGLEEDGIAALMRVIKVGGRVQRDPAVYVAIAKAWREREGSICIVHGGGDEVSSLQRLMGMEPKFVGGRRVTSEGDIDVLRMGLSGASNKRIVHALQNEGARAVGISGEDGALIGATQVSDARLGLVGSPTQVNAGLLKVLLTAGFLPVISPLGRNIVDGAALNINGDDAAAAIAGALRANELLLVADVPGVLADGAVIKTLSAEGTEALVRQGAATGGMIAKLEAALLALGSGVQSVRIGALGMISDARAGTTITLTPSLV